MVQKIVTFDVALKSTERQWVQKIPEIYTNDLHSVSLQFRISDCTDTELTGSTAIVLLKMRDGSFFQGPSPDVGRTLNVFSYNLKENEGNHDGLAEIQLIVTIDAKEFATQKYNFKVIAGLDSEVAREIMIYEWSTLTAEARAYIDQFTADELLRDAEFDNNEFDRNVAFNLAQTNRQSQFSDLAEDLTATLDAADANIAEFDVALETGIVAANLAEKFEDFESTNNSRLLSVESGLAEIDNTKADKTYVNTITQSLASGSPKGVYPTLAALQAAFPAGNANIYVVSADGKWYYWSGSTWVIGGVYQNTDSTTYTPSLTTGIGKYVRASDGVLVSLGAYNTTDLITLKYCEKLTVSTGTTATSAVAIISRWSADGTTFIKTLVKGNKTGAYEYAATEDVEYIRVSYFVADGVSLYLSKVEYSALKDNIILQVKADADLTEVFDNVLGYVPIIPTIANRYYYVRQNDGALMTSPIYNISDVYELKYGEKLTVDVGLNSAIVVAVLSTWTKGGTFIKTAARGVLARSVYTYIASESIEYVRVSYQIANGFTASVTPATKWEIENDIMGKVERIYDKDFLKHLVLNVACVGDSLTEGGYYGFGYNGAAIKENYPYFLAKMTDWVVDNKGKNGAIPSTWWTNFNATTDYTKYDTVIIGLGTNNGFTDTFEADVDITNQVFAATETGYYGKIINAFRQGNPDCHIFLAKVYYTSGDLATTNAVIEEAAVAFDCAILDESELAGIAVYHYLNNIHYGKVGNLYKANLFFESIIEHIKNNLTRYEILLDEY